MAEQEVRRNEAEQDKAKAQEDVGVLAGCNVEHGDEHKEQHQGRAQVLLEHDDQKRNGPHDQHRHQCAQVGNGEGPQLVREVREHFAVLSQIGCQEHHDADLRQLAWL